MCVGTWFSSPSCKRCFLYICSCFPPETTHLIRGIEEAHAYQLGIKILLCTCCIYEKYTSAYPACRQLWNKTIGCSTFPGNWKEQGWCLRECIARTQKDQYVRLEQGCRSQTCFQKTAHRRLVFSAPVAALRRFWLILMISQNSGIESLPTRDLACKRSCCMGCRTRILVLFVAKHACGSYQYCKMDEEKQVTITGMQDHLSITRDKSCACGGSERYAESTTLS